MLRNYLKSVLHIVTAIALHSFCIGYAQNVPTGKTGEIEQQIRVLDRDYADAVAKGDTMHLKHLFADEMIVTSTNGNTRNKAEEIKDLVAPDIKTYFFTTEDIQVRAYGDAAVVTGLMKWRIRYQEKDIDNARRYTFVYVKKLGQWQIVAQHIGRASQK